MTFNLILLLNESYRRRRRLYARSFVRSFPYPLLLLTRQDVYKDMLHFISRLLPFILVFICVFISISFIVLEHSVFGNFEISI